jgi:hypothetical protein
MATELRSFLSLISRGKSLVISLSLFSFVYSISSSCPSKTHEAVWLSLGIMLFYTLVLLLTMSPSHIYVKHNSYPHAHKHCRKLINLQGHDVIYDGFSRHRQNAADYTNLRQGHRRLANLQGWTRAIIGKARPSSTQPVVSNLRRWARSLQVKAHTYNDWGWVIEGNTS